MPSAFFGHKILIFARLITAHHWKLEALIDDARSNMDLQLDSLDDVKLTYYNLLPLPVSRTNSWRQSRGMPQMFGLKGPARILPYLLRLRVLISYNRDLLLIHRLALFNITSEQECRTFSSQGALEV